MSRQTEGLVDPDPIPACCIEYRDRNPEGKAVKFPPVRQEVRNLIQKSFLLLSPHPHPLGCLVLSLYGCFITSNNSRKFLNRWKFYFSNQWHLMYRQEEEGVGVGWVGGSGKTQMFQHRLHGVGGGGIGGGGRGTAERKETLLSKAALKVF